MLYDIALEKAKKVLKLFPDKLNMTKELRREFLDVDGLVFGLQCAKIVIDRVCQYHLNPVPEDLLKEIQRIQPAIRFEQSEPNLKLDLKMLVLTLVANEIEANPNLTIDQALAKVRESC
jgi:hypothetical protein